MNRKLSSTKTGRPRTFEVLEQRNMLAGDPPLRLTMPNEGYLRYSGGDLSPSGQERFGSTQTLHPAMLGDKDNSIGYDYGANRVAVRTVIVV